MNINSTLDCVLLYERIHNQKDPKKMISDNECLIKLMLRDQDFVQDLIDVYVKYTVHPDQHQHTKLDQMKYFVYSKLLEGGYFNKPEMIMKHYGSLIIYGQANNNLIGPLLATSKLWIGNPDEYDLVIQALNGYAEDYYVNCLEKTTVGAAIKGFAKYKRLERSYEDIDGGFVENPHCLYDLFILYKKSDCQDYVYEPLKEEFMKRLSGLSPEDKEKLVPYFDELIEGIRTNKISYQMGLRLSESKSVEEFMAQISGPSIKYHHIAFGDTFTN